MTELYLNVLHVHLRGYTDRPLIGEMTDTISLAVTVGAPVDIDQLVSEIGDDLAGQPSRIRQVYTRTNWGASSSGAEIFIDVSTVIGAVGSLPVLWNLISRRVLHRGSPWQLSAEQLADSARRFLAESLSIEPDSVQIVGVEPVGEGRRFRLETPKGSFALEIDSQGVSRMTRD